MSLNEIERRIICINKQRNEIKKNELRSFISILHLTISAGANPSKKNNRLFYQQIDKIFNDKDESEDDQSLDDIMGLVNGK